MKNFVDKYIFGWQNSESANLDGFSHFYKVIKDDQF